MFWISDLLRSFWRNLGLQSWSEIARVGQPTTNPSHCAWSMFLLHFLPVTSAERSKKRDRKSKIAVCCYPVRACAAGVKQCLRVCVCVCLSVCVSVCVCVCLQKNIEKCFKQGCKGVNRCYSHRKTISMILLGRFCTWYKSRRFFAPLFQLLPIIGFVAPLLSNSHVVFVVSNATRAPIRENTGGIDLPMYREARGVSIPWMHSSI